MVVPDPDRYPVFRCAPVRSDVDGDPVDRDVPVEVHVPDDDPDGLEVVPTHRRHRQRHEHVLAGRPCGLFYH